MSNRGGFRGTLTTRGGRGDFRGRGRGRGGGGFQQRDAGPPDVVIEIGTFSHAVEDEMLCSSVLTDKVPKFNSPIYLQNKSVIGRLDEILGPINEVYFSVKMGEGMVASSFKKGDKVYIGGDQLLSLDRFLPKPKTAGKVEKRGRGAGAGGRGSRGGRGGRGMQRGFGRGASRGSGAGRGFGDFRGNRGRGGFSRGRGRG